MRNLEARLTLAARAAGGGGGGAGGREDISVDALRREGAAVLEGRWGIFLYKRQHGQRARRIPLLQRSISLIGVILLPLEQKTATPFASRDGQNEIRTPAMGLRHARVAADHRLRATRR